MTQQLPGRTERNPYRLRPLDALRAFATLMREPENTTAGAVMAMSLAGRSIERHFQQFRSDPQGARILAERRCLFDRLSDREALGALSRGSLGRAYFDWTREENLSAQGLRDAVRPAVAGYDEMDEERRLVADRGRDTHDLWHVVTGYERDVIGESALVAFTLRQTRNIGLILPGLLGLLGSCAVSRRAAPLIFGAWRRAGSAVWLPSVLWEELLPTPLAEVRQQLALGTPPVYQPINTEGIPVEPHLRPSV